MKLLQTRTPSKSITIAWGLVIVNLKFGFMVGGLDLIDCG